VNARFTGLHLDGGYAEFAVARAEFVHPLPAGLAPAEAAPLLCAGVIGLRALRLALPPSIPSSLHPSISSSLPLRLGLYGFGASAHVCLQIARHWGCEVAVFTRAENHQQLASELGAAWVSTAEQQPPWLLDAGIIFAPAGELVPAALSHLDAGGTLALAGIHMTTIPQMEYRPLYGERVVRSVANSTRQDVLDLLKLAVEIPLRTTVETFALSSAQDALMAVRCSRTRGAAVLVPDSRRNV
jgi:propanol-preferring alcohol dehydrogenase